MILIYIIIIALLILAIIDVKFKSVPSFVTTTLLFVSAIVTQNFNFAIISALFGLLLYDLEYIDGLADIKLIALTGFFINNLAHLFGFMAFIVVFGNVWKIAVLNLRDKRKKKETAFIPVILITFIALWLLGWIY